MSDTIEHWHHDHCSGLEPILKGGELISRQQAIAMCRKPRMRNADCSDFEMEIMMLPSAQPKIGRWIHDGSKWTNRWICSECGYK